MGNHQEEGVDCNETFVVVVNMNTIRILLKVTYAKKLGTSTNGYP